MGKTKRKEPELLLSSPATPYDFDGDDDLMGKEQLFATAPSAAGGDPPCSEKSQMLHPENEKVTPKSSSFPFCLCRLWASSDREGGGGGRELFSGEAIWLKSVLLILGICFMVSTTAFIITACVVGLDMDGYDQWMAAGNHSKKYKSQAAELAMQRLEDMYFHGNYDGDSTGVAGVGKNYTSTTTIWGVKNGSTPVGSGEDWNNYSSTNIWD